MGNLCSNSPEIKKFSKNLYLTADTSKYLHLNHFKFISTIGKGSFAKVVLVQRKSSTQLFAIKLISKDHFSDIKKLEYVRNERNVLIGFENAYIVKLHHIFESQNNICFVLDFMQGGCLSYHIEKNTCCTMEILIFIAAEVLVALESLHEKGFIYRDLKPDNILFDTSGHLKLADFNLSINKAEINNSLCGTPDFAAPEVFLEVDQGVEVDFWAYGVLLFNISEGFLPFHSENRFELSNNVLELLYDHRKAPAVIRDLIQKFLVLDPKQRLTSYTDIKKHKLFSKIDWDLARNRSLPSPLKLQFSGPADLRYFTKKRYSALLINEHEQDTMQNDLSYNDELN